MKNKLLGVLIPTLAAVLVATLASAQPIPGFSKAYPITGNGTTASPLTVGNFTSGSAGAVPASGGGTTNFIRADGTWAAPPNTTYSVFTSIANGLAPLSGGGTTNYLRADGTWASPPNTTYTASSGVLLTGTNFTANLSGASCSAGSFVSAISAAGAGTCTAAPTGTVTGTGTANSIPKWTGTTSLGNSNITDSGTAVAVGVNTSVTGTLSATTISATGSIAAGSNIVGAQLTSSSYVAANTTVYAGANAIYLRASDQSLGCEEATNSAASCYLNRVGYHEGITQFRNLEIDDGKGAAIVFFDGAAKTSAFSGSISVAQSANIKGIAASNSGTGLTNGGATIESANAGTYNTTSAAISSYAVRAANTATRSAGANNLTNYGVWASASGAQVNQALWVDAGDYTFNTSTRGLVSGQFILGAGGQLRDSTTPPVITGTPGNCGTGATVVSGGNLGFTFSTGSSVSSCVVTFGTAFIQAPTCIAQSSVSGGSQYVTTTTTAATITGSASSLSSATVNVICMGH